MSIGLPRTNKAATRPAPSDIATRRLPDDAVLDQRTVPLADDMVLDQRTVPLVDDTVAPLHTRAALGTTEWGWLPALSLTSALGVLLLALGFAGARLASLGALYDTWTPWTAPLFWSGLVVVFLPLAARLLMAAPFRRERIGIVLLFGVGLFLAKLLQYPVAFAYHDEFLHWRTANDILQTGHLFGDNPLLPVSALFPGLEIVTSALAQFTGLSLFGAGVVVLLAARVVLVLGLFLLYEHVSQSGRVAGIATLLYMVNPKLIFFDAQFSYESLALPFTALALWALARYATAKGAEQHAWTAAALVALGAGLITHHLTAYAFALFLVVWTVVAFVRRRSANARHQSPAGIALLAVVANLVWLMYVATLVVNYLAPHIEGAVRELLLIISGEQGTRRLFQDHTGHVTPVLERGLGFAATLLILFGLPFGLYWMWRQYRRNTLALALGVAALAYPASLAFRFTQAGSEASDRAAGVVFIALGFTLAIGIVALLRMHPHRWMRTGMLSLMAVVFLGEVVVGAGPAWNRMPGAYLVSADSRSIEQESVDAAYWMRDYLGTGNRVATDRINRLLDGAYGEQYTLTHARTGQDVSPLFTELGFGPVQQTIVQQQHVQYVVVDRRLSTGLPQVGIYFEAPEPNALKYTKPLDPLALAKWDRLLDVQRVFDSGSIIVYKLGNNVREP